MSTSWSAQLTHGIALALSLLDTAFADEPRVERLIFDPGTTSTRVDSSLTGYEAVDYIVPATSDQMLVVTMHTSNAAAYFNLMKPGESDVAFFIGSTEGLSYAGIVPQTGDYTIRVYQMRSAARRQEEATYTLNVTVTSGDYADGLMGGPDYWRVTGVTNTLSLRSAPTTRAEILDRLANGTVLRNKGCRIAGQRRWCQVEQTDNPRLSGWVAGDFLEESSQH